MFYSYTSNRSSLCIGLQSRFGDKLLRISLVCPENGTEVLKGLRTWYVAPYTLLLRGTIVNGTYGIHKNLYISPFLLTKFGAINYGPP